MGKTTLILGASPNPERYSYRAVMSLQQRKIPVIALGLRDGEIGKVRIRKGKPDDLGEIHTIGLYLGPKNQADFIGYILQLKPSRIIFNPGTWNPELASLGRKSGIEIVDDCMLAMLSCGHY